LACSRPRCSCLVTRALNSLSGSTNRVHTQLPPRYLDDPDVRATLGVLVRDVVQALEQPCVIAAGLGSLADDLVRRGQSPPVGQAITNAIGDRWSCPSGEVPTALSRVTETQDGVALHFAQLVVNAAPDHSEALQFVSNKH